MFRAHGGQAENVVGSYVWRNDLADAVERSRRYRQQKAKRSPEQPAHIKEIERKLNAMLPKRVAQRS
jgi:hypothetical protein